VPFRRQLLAGFSTSIGFAAIATWLAIGALRASADDETRLARQYGDQLVAIERVRAAADRMSDERPADAASELAARVDVLRDAVLSEASASDLVAIRAAVHDGGARAALHDHVRALVRREQASFERALAAAHERAGRAGLVVGLVGGIGLVLSAVLAGLVIRRLLRQHTAERDAMAEARRSAAAREEMLAIVSHDLRSPLGAIVTAAELLADRQSDGESRRHVDILRFAAERMTHLVEQIVDTAQLEAGDLQLALCSCDVGQLLRDVADQFASAAATHAIAVRCEPPLGPACALADRERVAQVVANLVGNALKFTPRGGSVTLRADPGDDAITVAVEDSGPGLDPEEAPHVFDRYWRGPRAAGSRGLGLGLYICKRLVEAHRGRIWVESQPEHGACFQFTLPRERGAHGTG